MTATDKAGDISVSTLTVIVPFVAPSAQIVGVPANEYVPEGYAFSLAGVVDNPTPETLSPNRGRSRPATARRRLIPRRARA